MIISLRLKNFFSLRDDAVLDFTADSHRKKQDLLPENLIEFSGDKFINIIGLFGSNAAGKSNIIKALDFCRNLVLESHKFSEGMEYDFRPFKFEKDIPSEFYLNFVTEGVEYEYSFSILNNRILSESLYHFPNKRKAKVFSRTNTTKYTYGKGLIPRPAEVEVNTGPNTLFLSRAASMNRQIARGVYKFFLREMLVPPSPPHFVTLTPEAFERKKEILLKAFEVSDSDIVDIRLIESGSGPLRLQTFHRENPAIPFDFDTEESDGTKRLFYLLLQLLDTVNAEATIFLDEFDLKLHLRLAEFVLDVVRASRGAQLVFTSHTSSLINMTRLRPEQIIFVTKQSDGNSEFIPLSDYTGIGPKADIQKAYLQGRFDGVPYIGDIYAVLHDMMQSK